MPRGKLDLGSVQIHRNVLMEIICTAVNEIDGAGLPKKKFSRSILSVVGVKTYPGIILKVLNKNDINIEIQIYVRYGVNIPSVAAEVQSSVTQAIEKTINIQTVNIKVNILGIVRAS